jgi:hypothetical protein
MYSTHYSCQILMKAEFSRQIFEKYSSIKFHENPPSGSRIVPRGRTDGQTDMTKLIVAFRNFANASRNWSGRIYLRATRWSQLIYAFKDLNWLDTIWILISCWPLAWLNRLLREGDKNIDCTVNCHVRHDDTTATVTTMPLGFILSGIIYPFTIWLRIVKAWEITKVLSILQKRPMSTAVSLLACLWMYITITMHPHFDRL